MGGGNGGHHSSHRVTLYPQSTDGLCTPVNRTSIIPVMSAARRTSTFRPCIDLHDGLVKQIVGGTLSDASPEQLKTNFVARSLGFMPVHFATS